ncbi:MAG: agmatinase family protein [Pseudohongiella sp.]|nr:agmatinase family protein [Pseudohongiella sp.]
MKRYTHLMAGVLFAASSALAQEPETEREPIVFPPELQAKITGLSAEQIDYLNRETRNRDNLFEAMGKRSAEEVVAYVEALMWMADQRRFREGRDIDYIPLNTAAPDFNAWTTRRPGSFNPAREAGPLELGRYVGGFGGGLPTFAGAPVALTPEDLIAGDVDVAIVGAPLNMGSGWRDADHGPLALRGMYGMSGNDQYVQVNPSTELNIVDYGDIAIDNNNTERAVQEVRSVVYEILQAGALPLIIGGDHSLAFPDIAAMVDHYGKGKVAVVHFDAHYDVGRDRTHLIDHGQPVYRLMAEGLIEGKDYIQVGLRAGSPDEATYKWMQEEGFRYHSMAEVERFGWDFVLERVLKEARDDTEKGKVLFLSFDVDILDPVYTGGTGTPVSGGITPREAIPLVRRLCAESDVAGFELVEVAPALDPTYKTTLHSAAIVKACLTGIAMRKKGLTDPHYLNPTTLDHGQDDYQRRYVEGQQTQ